MTIAFSQKPFLVLIISIEKLILFNIIITMDSNFTKFIPRSFLTHKSISVKGRSMKSILSVFVMNIRLKASNQIVCTQYIFTVHLDIWSGLTPWLNVMAFSSCLPFWENRDRRPFNHLTKRALSKLLKFSTVA